MNKQVSYTHLYLSQTETEIKWSEKNDVDFGIVETPFQE